MTVPSTTNLWQYSGNGVTTSFSYTSKIFSASDLVVTRTDALGVDTTLVLNTDYTVSGVGSKSGGAVTYPVSGSALPSGEKITIRRVVDLTQNTSIKNQGAYYPEIHEDAFDRSMMIDQQQQNQIDRSLQVAESVSGFNGTLPALESGKYLRVKAGLDGFELAPSTTNGTPNTTTHTYHLEFTDGGSGAGISGSNLNSVLGITLAAGDIIQTEHFDSNKTAGSGAPFQFTGVTTAGKAGECPNADGYFYDAVGKQFILLSETATVRPEQCGECGTEDDTEVLQAACMAAAVSGPGGSVVLITQMHNFTALVSQNNQIIMGCGKGTGFKIKDGFTHRDAGGNVSSCGVYPAGDIEWGGFYNFEVDGNYTNTTDYGTSDANRFANGFSAGVFIKGRYRGSNISVTPFSPGEASPDFFFLDKLYSKNALRNNYFANMGLNRSDSGQLKVGSIIAENSAVDHGFYCDTDATVHIDSLTLKGYFDGSAFVSSGLTCDHMEYVEIAANPNINTTEEHSWETQRVIHDRGDFTGSAYGRCFVDGDLSLLNQAPNDTYAVVDADFRCFVQQDSNGLSIDSLKIIHRGAVDSGYFAAFLTSGFTGSVRGMSCQSVNAFGMPEDAQLLRHDYSNLAANLTGVDIALSVWSWGSGAGNVDHPFVDFGSTDGTQVRSVDIHGGLVYEADFGEGGAEYIFSQSYSSGAFEQIHFYDTSYESTNNAVPPWVVTSGPDISQIKVENVHSRNSFPSGDSRDLVNMVDVVFAGPLLSNNWGTYVTDGDGVTTEFTIPHGMGTIQTPRWIQAQVGDVGAAGPDTGAIKVTPFSSSIRVSFDDAPPSGTGNVVIHWEARL